MAQVVLVHGIAQQQTSGPTLEQAWVLALAGGLQKAGFAAEADRLRMGIGVADRIDTRMAYYGDLFIKPGAQSGDGITEVTSDDQAALMETLAYDWLQQAATRATKIATRSAAQAELTALDGPKEGAQAQSAGRTIRRAIDALTRVPGLADVGMAVMGRYVLRTLTQVTRYLADPVVRETTQQRIASLITSDTRVLIGHSLGSVAAYEAAHRLAGGQSLPLLVTLGSPLGLRSIVIDHLKPPASFPPLVRHWANIADLDDYIATLPDLTARFGHDKPSIANFESLEVDNEDRAHHAERYLSKREVGERLGPVLRGIG